MHNKDRIIRYCVLFVYLGLSPRMRQNEKKKSPRRRQNETFYVIKTIDMNFST